MGLDSLNASIGNYAQGVNTSIQQLLGGVNTAGGSVSTVLEQALKIKQTLSQITGHGTNQTAAQQATANAGITLPVSDGVKNILIVVGIVAGGIGIIYLVKGK